MAHDDPRSSRPGAPESTESTELAASGESRPERRGPPPNPIQHPLFLPVLLVLFTLWFFFDGFINTDPEMAKHQTFNRVGFVVTALCCLRFVPRGIREYREDQEAAAARQEGRESGA